SNPVPAGFARFMERYLETKGFSVPVPDFPTRDQIHANPEKASDAVQLWVAMDKLLLREKGFNYDDLLRQSQPPLAIPTPESRDGQHDPHDPKQWEPYASASLGDVANYLAKKPRNDAVQYWTGIIEAYAKDDVKEFNTAVKDYTDWLAHEPPAQLAKAS